MVLFPFQWSIPLVDRKRDCRKSKNANSAYAVFLRQWKTTCKLSHVILLFVASHVIFALNSDVAKRLQIRILGAKFQFVSLQNQFSTSKIENVPAAK